MSTSQQSDPMIGRLVDGRYRVRARIARGGMATVYVATDLRLERRVALKVMHGHLTDDVVFQSRFIQEARAAARLANPHVVSVFDQGQDAGMAYLVMEYLPGITLRELMRQERRLTVAQAVTIMDATLTGLAAAHRAGIVHRDVKPENILLAEDGRIKIGDFGLARATTANTASGQLLLGTIAYIAPELITRGTADARSDIYALGIMLYEMLTGEQPYKGEQPMQIAFQHATESVPRPSARNPGVPEQLDELVLWATEKMPEARPADAQEMLDRLREIEQELRINPVVTVSATTGIQSMDDGMDSGDLTKVLAAATAPIGVVEEVDNATSLRRRAQRRHRKGGWLVVVVLLLAALAGGLGWWFGSGPGSLVAVPDVSGKDFATAQTLLVKNSLRAEQAATFDREVAKGLAVRTDPEIGQRIDKNVVVKVFISQGPKPQQIEPLVGKTADAATGIVTGKNLLVGDSTSVFDAKAPTGTVVTATLQSNADGKTSSCTKGCDAFEGDTILLTVSVGPVPSVTGLSVDDATNALYAKDLQVNPERQEKYDPKIPNGKVIGLVPVKGALHPQDTVQLIVSKGPQPIAVPNVVGLTVRQAIDKLNAAGLEGHSDLLEVFWDIYKVTAINPGEGTLQLPGTVVSITGLTV